MDRDEFYERFEYADDVRDRVLRHYRENGLIRRKLTCYEPDSLVPPRFKDYQNIPVGRRLEVVMHHKDGEVFSNMIYGHLNGIHPDDLSADISKAIAVSNAYDGYWLIDGVVDDEESRYHIIDVRRTLDDFELPEGLVARLSRFNEDNCSVTTVAQPSQFADLAPGFLLMGFNSDADGTVFLPVPGKPSPNKLMPGKLDFNNLDINVPERTYSW